MNKYVLAINLGAILFLISCVGFSAYAQPMTNTTSSSPMNMTASQVQNLLCHNGQVCLYPPIVHPTSGLIVSVGDSFYLRALVFNNSPNSIYYRDICFSPLSAIFDSHSAIHTKIGCFATNLVTIPAHSFKFVTGPASNREYDAVQAGFATGIATFRYFTTPTLTPPSHSVNTGFVFVIFP